MSLENPGFRLQATRVARHAGRSSANLVCVLIGDLAAQAGLSAKAIRFYEQAGLMPAPSRRPAGYRDYPPAALGRLMFIRQAHAAFTLAEVGGILAIRDSGHARAGTSAA